MITKNTDNDSRCSKNFVPLLISVAINIFLAAFILGRVSMPGMMPPPFEHHHVGIWGGSEHNDMRQHPMAQGPGHGDHSPFIGPANIFTPEEMKANEEQMHQTFDKVKALRIEFANQLKKGPVSKEQALQHFAEINKLISTVRSQTQEKAATKISTMSQQEREDFAQKLLEK